MSGEPVWISGSLRIRRETLEAIEAHALECYPSESCGFGFGPANDPLLVDGALRENNEADKYHALDPVAFPRTSRTYFKINELRAHRMFETYERDGTPIKVIYHSHCDAGAYFSAEDTATFSQGGILMWPCAFIVVSVVGRAVVDRKLWIHVAATDAFEESMFEIV